MADENGATTDTTQGPLGSPSGQLLQRGMNFLFGVPQKKGMVPPTSPVATVKPVQPPAPVQPNIAPTMDLNSPNNVMTAVDRMEAGR